MLLLAGLPAHAHGIAFRRVEQFLLKDMKKHTILNSIALAMGVAVFVLAILGDMSTNNAASLLAIGVVALALNNFLKREG